MNMFKKLFGADHADALVSIPTGQLILSRAPSSPKSGSECLYTDAVISIRQTTSSFHYQLVVQKALEESDEQLKDPEDDSDDSLLNELESGDQRSFFIDKELKVYKYINDEGNTTIVWKDFDGDEGDKYTFVCDISVDDALVQKFMKTIWRCEYEAKFQKSSKNVTDKDLQEFMYDPEKEVLNRDLLQNLSRTERDDSDTDSVSSQDFKDAADSAQGDAVAVSVKEPSGDLLGQFLCELYFYDFALERFAIKNDKVTVKLIQSKKFVFWLSFNDSKGRPILVSEINNTQSPAFNYDVTSFTFDDVKPKIEDSLSWLAKFSDGTTLTEFQTVYMQCLWETLNRSQWKTAKSSDMDYFVDAFSDLKVADDEVEKLEYIDPSDSEIEADEEDEEEEEEEKVASRKLRSGTKKHLVYDSDDDDTPKFSQGGHPKDSNRALAVSYKNDRSYVVRGNRIGVFKVGDEDDDLEFQTAIENVKNLKGEFFSPEKVMLHNEDQSLIMHDPNHLSNLYRMDLHKGKIVEEYKVAGKDDEAIAVLESAPVNKFSQLTSEQTFLGMSTDGLFKVDPRLSGNNLVDSQYKKYATATKFSSIATNALGHIAVAGKNGEIKLYDKLGLNAKTRLPGLGEDIKGLDISADGKWVLATCDTYLLLVDTRIKTGKNAGNSGFVKSFAIDDKPRPIILELKREHVLQIQASTHKKINFTVAHFNAGLDATETSIISSAGPFVIRWSLRKVLKANKEPYKIIRYNLDITNNNFKFGSDKNAIVTMSDDVALVHKNKFQRFSKKSLGG